MYVSRQGLTYMCKISLQRKNLSVVVICSDSYIALTYGPILSKRREICSRLKEIGHLETRAEQSVGKILFCVQGGKNMSIVHIYVE